MNNNTNNTFTNGKAFKRDYEQAQTLIPLITKKRDSLVNDWNKYVRLQGKDLKTLTRERISFLFLDLADHLSSEGSLYQAVDVNDYGITLRLSNHSSRDKRKWEREGFNLQPDIMYDIRFLDTADEILDCFNKSCTVNYKKTDDNGNIIKDENGNDVYDWAFRIKVNINYNHLSYFHEIRSITHS